MRRLLALVLTACTPAASPEPAALSEARTLVALSGPVLASARPACAALPPDRGEACTAAVDALVAFAQERVYDPLSDARGFPTLPAPCAGLWPQAAEVVSVYDPDELRRGLFVCDLAFDFHGIE